MSSNTHVPDKLEGYMLQVRHALYELISVDDRTVSVEGYDDVAVETDDLVVAEQTKNVLSDNNPVANRAVAFWKTLKNWCEYLQNGELPDKTIVLKYVIVADRNLAVGDIPESFAKAKDNIEAKVALDAAKHKLLDDKDGEKQAELGATLKPYLDFCFAAENEASILQVISTMQIEVHNDTYDGELKKKFSNQIIPEEYVDVLFLTMLGWVSEHIHRQAQQNRAAYIRAEDYRRALEAQIRSCDQRQILKAISAKPDAEDMGAEVDRRDIYIRQLELIDTNTTKQLQAASDFLRTKAEITAWAKKGIVTTESFSDYESKLKRMWGNQCIIVGALAISDETVKGQVLLSYCEIDAQKQLLQGASTPDFFGAGSLHALANEPTPSPAIGWHPRYTELLKGDGENVE